MAHRIRRRLLVAGLLALALAGVLISRLPFCGDRLGGDEGRSLTLVGHTLPVQALAFGPDGATLTSAAYHFGMPGGQVEAFVWDSATGGRRAAHTEPGRGLLALTFAPGARLLACTGREGALRLWHTASWHEQSLLGESTSVVCALACSADGSQLAAADFLNVTLWDVATGRRRAWCHEQGPLPCALAFAPDTRTLASGNADSTLRLWDTATGEGRGTLTGHASPVLALAFAPDGRVLASGDRAGMVKLWDVAAATERATLGTSVSDVLVNEVTAVTFAPDGGTLAVAIDRVVQLWDVATRRLVARLPGHEGKVKCLAYSPDGTCLASGSYDQRVRLWNVAWYRPRRP